jgi:hypothetical protein
LCTTILYPPRLASTESAAFLDACRQLRKVKQAIPTRVTIASDPAAQRETTATLNQAAMTTMCR